MPSLYLVPVTGHGLAHEHPQYTGRLNRILSWGLGRRGVGIKTEVLKPRSLASLTTENLLSRSFLPRNCRFQTSLSDLIQMTKGNRAGTAFFHPNHRPIPSPHRPAYYVIATPEKSGGPQRKAPRPRRPPKPITCKQLIVSLALWHAQPCRHWVLCDNCFLWAYCVRCLICRRPVRYYQRADGDFMLLQGDGGD